MTTAPRVLALTALLAACGLPLAAAEVIDVKAAESKPTAETKPAASEDCVMQIDNRKVPVENVKDREIKFKRSATEDDIDFRELWSTSFDGVSWSAWQKHNQTFPKDTPIIWPSVQENHWRVYLRRVNKSGAAAPLPDASFHTNPAMQKAMTEFIVDRTAPKVAVLFPEAKAKLRGGIQYPVRWDASDPHLRDRPVVIEWTDGKGKWETVAENLTNNGSFDWTVPKAMTSSGVLKVSVADKAGNSAFAQSDQILVDSMNPRGRVTGPLISNKQDVALDVEVNDGGPAGLKDARLWISQDDGTSWSEGSWINDPFKTVAWKAPADGRYRLYILATDQAGNPSPTPKGKAEDQFVLLVDSTRPVVQLGSAIGIVEADKPAGNRTSFKAGTRVAVPFTVKDANLDAKSAAVYLQTDSAKGWDLLAENLATDAAYRFALPTVATKTARIKVLAKDAAGNVGEVTAGEAFQIDTEVSADILE